MRVLVTGAAGFIGSHIVRKLRDRGDIVVALQRRSLDPAVAKANPGLIRLSRDLACDDIEVTGPVDAVVHASARSRPDGETAADYTRDNVVATERLAEFSARGGRCGKIVFLSSLSVYGTVSAPVVDETTPCVEPGFYGLSKLQGERILAEHAESVPAIALRLPGVVGRGCGDAWAARVARLALAGAPIAAYNPDAPFNNALHVDDLAVFVSDLCHRPLAGFDVVTLASGGRTTVREAVEIVRSNCHSVSPVILSASPRTSFVVSTQRAQNRYGFAPMDIVKVMGRLAGDLGDATDGPS